MSSSKSTTTIPSDTGVTLTPGSDANPVDRYLTERRRVTRAEVDELLKLARANNGELVHVTAFGDQRDPDDWCGTMWFKGPRPKVGGLVDTLIGRGWGVEIFPLGIINPTDLAIRVRNQTRF